MTHQLRRSPSQALLCGVSMATLMSVLAGIGCCEASGGDASPAASGEVHPVFTASVEELVAKHGAETTAYGDDPEAIAISARYIEGLNSLQGRDEEALPFLEFLENEDWSEGYLAEWETLSGRAQIAQTCVGALAQIAYLPDNKMSENIRQRSLVQTKRLAEIHGDSWEVQATCVLAFRTLLAAPPEYNLTEQPYTGWIEKWMEHPRVREQTERSFREWLPARFGIDPPPMSENAAGPE